MKSEHKKLVLALVLLIAAGGVYWRFGRSSAPLPDAVRFVCVETGQVFPIARDKIPSVLPAENPKTHHKTLLPIVEREGKLYANPRHADALREPELAKVNKHVDPQTLEVVRSPRP
jgi:hypothetical protein